MKILFKCVAQDSRASLEDAFQLYDAPHVFSILLSATCIGNDGRSCPLFHGSLAPIIFGKTSDQTIRRPLLQSNNITWVNSVFSDDSLQEEIFKTLAKTRYSSRSLKRLQVNVDTDEKKTRLNFFLTNQCDALETLDLSGADATFPLIELASSRPLTNSLIRLIFSSVAIPDFPQIQHFTRLRDLFLMNMETTDEQLHSLSSLKDLRRLELLYVTKCTGSFLDVVCTAFRKLQDLTVQSCANFSRVSGLKHLSDSLEGLSLNFLQNIDGYEEWTCDFFALKSLELCELAFVDQQEKSIALSSSSAFAFLQELDLAQPRHPFFTRIIEACHQSPIRKVTVRDTMSTEFAEALLMVPVEELHLEYSTFFQQLPPTIIWSEEKTITKTLKSLIVEGYYPIPSISFLSNCKRLECLSLGTTSRLIDLSALASLPNLKKFAFITPSTNEASEVFQLKNLFTSSSSSSSATQQTPVVVIPSLEILEFLEKHMPISFEGMENILPNLKVFDSMVTLEQFEQVEEEEEMLNSFLYLVRNFPKLEEMKFADEIGPVKKSRIARVLKKEKPSLIIYYSKLCQYMNLEIEDEK
jgi:hypothetical protein